MKNNQITVRKLALPVMISALVMSGCSTMSDKTASKTTSASNADMVIVEKDKQISSLESSLQEERAARSRLEQDRESFSTASAQSSTPMSAPELLPPNAKAGECYARVFTAPTYKTEKLTVLKKDASQRIEIIPARYEMQSERVMIKEPSERIEVVPAKYEWVTEKVLVAPASERIEEVPAVYKTEYEKILDKPEHTIWKKGTGPITKIDAGTGEIMCLVTVPATYKTVSKRILVSKATTRAIAIPAKYKTVKKRIVKAAPTTRTVTIPAEYKIIKARKLVQPGTTNSIPIKAEYTTITKRMKVTEGKMDWAPVLCKTNMNNQVGLRLQKSLKAAGFNPGPLDGVIGVQTMSATKAYQRAKGLSTGGLTMETLGSLGVKLAN
jgi:hypothetical protein